MHGKNWQSTGNHYLFTSFLLFFYTQKVENGSQIIHMLNNSNWNTNENNNKTCSNQTVKIIIPHHLLEGPFLHTGIPSIWLYMDFIRNGNTVCTWQDHKNGYTFYLYTHAEKAIPFIISNLNVFFNSFEWCFTLYSRLLQIPVYSSSQHYDGKIQLCTWGLPRYSPAESQRQLDSCLPHYWAAPGLLCWLACSTLELWWSITSNI